MGEPNSEVQKTEPAIKLDKYFFHRGTRLTDEEKDKILNYYKDLTIETSKKELSVSFQSKNNIAYLIFNQFEWIKERLNITVGARLPEFNKIKFFSPEEWEELRLRLKEPEEWCGTQFTPSNDILVLETGNENQTFSNLNHEIVHCLSQAALKVTKNNLAEVKKLYVKPTLSGYRNFYNETFRSFNEAITEMISIEMLEHIRKNRHGKDYLSHTDIGYNASVIFFDLLIEEAAKRLGKDSYSVRTDLYKGYFEGNAKALSIFKKAFGKDGIKVLASLKDGVEGKTYLKILGETFFGIDGKTYMNKIYKYKDGEEIEILGGIKIKNGKIPANVPTKALVIN